MGGKIEKLFEPQRVSFALEHGVEKGIARETLSIFADPRGRIILAEAIRKGEYKIQPPQIVLVPKKEHNEKREVYANNPLDRVVLTLINSLYYELYADRIHPCCVSYRKGIGVKHIISSITNKLEKSPKIVGYKADLSKYFDSVNIETLDKELKSFYTDSPIDRLIWNYYHDDRVIDKNGNEITHYKSLAQGCAFGAFLANTILRDIDEVLSNMDILYYRYSDDLLMLGKDANLALRTLEGLLEEKGLFLNPQKVIPIDTNTTFDFLGFEIKKTEVSLSKSSVKRFKDEIKKITKIRKGMPINSRTVQRKAIKRINNYLYNDYMINTCKFGWMEYFAGISTNVEQMKMLDEFVKDHLKAMYTGKHNHTTNRNKTPNDILMEMGYHSMVNLYKLRKMGKGIYEAELTKLS